MKYSRNRRNFLLAMVALPIGTVWTACASKRDAAAVAQEQLTQLERTLAGRIGVFAINTANGAQLSYRADEFPHV
jgi:beta-lactamase class A